MKPPVFEERHAFDAWLKGRAEALAMDVRQVPLCETAPDWEAVTSPFGALWRILRKDGLFFQVTGIRVMRAAGREVTKWAQPIIDGETGGHLAFVNCPERQIFLVRAKAEPGNLGVCIDGQNTSVLVSPPFQFSEGNYRKHAEARGKGGKPIPLMGFLRRHAMLGTSCWRPGPEDGGRFWHKVNLYAVIDGGREFVMTDLEESLDELGAEQQRDFAWVSHDVLRYIRDIGHANQFLRAGMAYLF